MSDLRVINRQNTYSGVGEDDWVAARGNPRGELISVDWYQQLVLDGRVYQINNAAIETATAATTSFATNGTNPFIYVGVPSGTSIMPMEIRLTQGGSVANNAFTVLCAYEDAALYSTGGSAVDVQNERTDAPNTSGCVAYTGATVTAPSDDRLLHGGIYSQNVDDPDHADESFFWSIRNSIAPVLVGPASLLIYAYVGATAPSLWFRVSWWECPTVNLKTS